MFDIKLIRDDPAAFDKARRRRGLEPLASKLIALDETRRSAIAALQVAQERRNAASKEIGLAMREKNAARADELKAEVARLKDDFPKLEEAEREAGTALETALLEIPNSPLPEVPEGADEEGNVLVRSWGEDFKARAAPGLNRPKEHFEIGEALGLMDFEAASKMSGARFVVLKGRLARLERALMQFMLDLHTDHHAYTEIDPPLLVRDHAMIGTAQLPKFREDQFLAISSFATVGNLREYIRRHGIALDAKEPDAQVEIMDEWLPRFEAFVSASSADDLLLYGFPKTQSRWLIPTAEVPLTNLVSDQIVDEASLPLRFTAGTHCFRAEAGAAGRDTRGMIRQHQFAKVELVSITTPDEALAEHERMTACAEEVLKRLELPYRVMLLCTGDMGFASQKTYDLEVWLPGQGRYREISSCSVCGDFQARRMNARYRPKDAKNPRFVATLNGSGVAVGRALVAVLENYQQADGSVVVPDALRPYMGGADRIELAATPLPVPPPQGGRGR